MTASDIESAGMRKDANRLGMSYLRARADAALTWMAGIWVMGAGMVLFEPSPYEFGFVIVLVLAIIARTNIYRSSLPLLTILVLFTPFALIAAFQTRHFDRTDALIFQIVTIFLLTTGFFLANYLAERTYERMRVIMWFYTAIAMVSALLAVGAYLGLVPNPELFTLYGRAKALFNDPNVFGPFIILPAMFALQKLLLETNIRRLIWPALVFLLLGIGVFLSFSRAAWGHLALSMIIVFLLAFLLEAKARDKARMLLLALGGSLVMVVALAGVLSIPSVNQLFEVRASASQNYDTGESGRFGRQGYAFELALAHPWGLGPREFENLSIVEAPHNTYVTVIHHYGWGGALCWLALILMTLHRAVDGLIRNNNRLLLIPLISVYVPLIMEAAIIDIDHWRHYFVVVGLIWGVTATRSKTVSRKEALL